MKRLWTVLLVLGIGLGLTMACGSNQDVCPSILDEESDNSRCCEALRFCCDNLSGNDEEIKEAKVECGKFVNGTDVSCKSQYHSFLSFGRCKPLEEAATSK